MENVTAVDIEKYLSGADFPCDKQMLIKEAKSKDAPSDVVNMLNSLPNREYSDVADVSAAMGE